MRVTLLFLFAIALQFPTYAQWETVPSPVSGEISDIKFINDSVGFCASTDGVLKTSDFGNTWNLLSSSPSGSHLFFVDESIGYLTSRVDRALYKSIDSGDTWQLIEDFSDETPGGVFFTSLNVGYVITSIYGPPGGSFIYRTTNGGVDWTQTHSFPSIPTLQAITFTTINTGFIVGYSGRIIKTSNAGTDWTVEQLTSIETLLAVHFPDQMTGYAVGYPGISGSEVIKTEDGGNSWENLSSGGTINTALRGVYFTTVNNGYAVGEDGRIITTDDGGATWNTSESGVSSDLYATTFTANSGFAVGNQGRIIKTSINLSSTAFVDKQKYLKLYPNPAVNELRIESEAEIEEISLFDLSGRRVTTFVSNFGELNIADYPAGVYFLRILTNEGMRTEKFVKQ